MGVEHLKDKILFNLNVVVEEFLSIMQKGLIREKRFLL